jgi:hypothetical protein
LRLTTAEESARELARVLDRARRLQARHLRQAAAAAAAVRSAGAAVSVGAGWPADPAARLSDRVTAWTGDVAAGVAVPVWPPAPPPGEEGGSGIPGLVSPVLADLPGGTPDPAPRGPGLDGPVPDLDGLTPAPIGPDPWGHLPGGPWLPIGTDGPALPAATTPSGWLDTGAAPAVRPPLNLPGPISDPIAPATPADLATPLRPGLTPAGPAARPGQPIPRGYLAGRADTPGRGTLAHDTPAGHERPSRGETHSRGPLSRETSTHYDTPGHHVAAGRDDAPGRRPEAPGHEPGEAGRHDAPGRGESSGRGGEAPGSGRLGGHVALGGLAGPGGPAGLVDPTSQQVAAGGGSVAATGTPPPLPAPLDAPAAADRQPVDRTVEQQAAPPPAPEHHQPAVERPADPVDRAAPRANPPEPGRLSLADPNVRPPAPPAPTAHSGQVAAKGRDDADLAAVLVGPLPADGVPRTGGPGGLRAYLLSRPAARPILVLIKPGGSGEPLFLTGLTPCAGPLPACAAPVPATGPTTVY